MRKWIPVALSAVVLLIAALAVRPGMAGDPPVGNETTEWVNKSISSSALIVSATTGKKTVWLGGVLRSSGAGIVAIQDGAGGSTLANIYLEANTPLVINPSDLGEGVKTTAGTGLAAELSGATLTGTLRVRTEN